MARLLKTREANEYVAVHPPPASTLMGSHIILLDALLLAACVVLFASSHVTYTRSGRPSAARVAVLALFLANVGVALVGLLVSVPTPDTFMAGDHVILPTTLLLVATLYWTSSRAPSPSHRGFLTLRGIAWRAAIALYLGVILLGM